MPTIKLSQSEIETAIAEHLATRGYAVIGPVRLADDGSCAEVDTELASKRTRAPRVIQTSVDISKGISERNDSRSS